MNWNLIDFFVCLCVYISFYGCVDNTDNTINTIAVRTFDLTTIVRLYVHGHVTWLCCLAHNSD